MASRAPGCRGFLGSCASASRPHVVAEDSRCGAFCDSGSSIARYSCDPSCEDDAHGPPAPSVRFTYGRRCRACGRGAFQRAALHAESGSRGDGSDDRSVRRPVQVRVRRLAEAQSDSVRSVELEAPAVVERYEKIFTYLRTIALDPPASRRVIETMKEALE